MAINIGSKKVNAYIGNKKIKAYLGAKKVYPSGNSVTYYVDTGVIYQEEVDEGASCLSPKTFTPTKSGWEFVGWRKGATAMSSDIYTSLTMGDEPVTLYAVFRQTITVTYYNGNTTKQTTTGYRYYNNGNISNPSFTLTQTALSDWAARGWSTGTAGNAGITYSNGVAFTRDSNITLYGMYYQTITVTYYNGNTNKQTTTGTRYYNPGSGAIVNPSFALTQASLTGWTARGWSTGTAGNSGITYSNAVAFTLDANITLYGMYHQTITLSYNGNGATSGSTAAQTGTRYYNSNGNATNPTFTLSACGFAKTAHTCFAWATGTDGATRYSAGAQLTLSSSTTLYALWKPSNLSNPVKASGDKSNSPNWIYAFYNQEIDLRFVKSITFTVNRYYKDVAYGEPSDKYYYNAYRFAVGISSNKSTFSAEASTVSGFESLTKVLNDTVTHTVTNNLSSGYIGAAVRGANEYQYNPTIKELVVYQASYYTYITSVVFNT